VAQPRSAGWLTTLKLSKEKEQKQLSTAARTHSRRLSSLA